MATNEMWPYFEFFQRGQTISLFHLFLSFLFLMEEEANSKKN